MLLPEEEEASQGGMKQHLLNPPAPRRPKSTSMEPEEEDYTFDVAPERFRC